jgi:tetraacyldisaccharide 4'-kinase
MNKLRWLLLLPFGLLYGLITGLRNKLFDLGILKTYKMPVPAICVGNLSTGGTGKTPHVAYLAALLKDELKVHILSRGYGRNTRGFILLDENSTSEQVGDEPLFYQTHFQPEVRVAVCESRQEGIEKLLEIEQPGIILLDDAFQHRHVAAGLSILLTEYGKPYFSDFPLPAGNLREWRSGRKRADLLIVTKCPPEIPETVHNSYLKKLRFDPQRVYFSRIAYGTLTSFVSGIQFQAENVLLVTGIAHPDSLEAHLSLQYQVERMDFPDHHDYSLSDIQKIHKKFDTFASQRKVIVTTEKDFMRLRSLPLAYGISERPWFYQPITVCLDRENTFKTEIKRYAQVI